MTVAVGVLTAAWLALVAGAVWPAGASATGGSAGAPLLAMVHGAGQWMCGVPAAAGGWAALRAGLPRWALMTAAVMGPAALGGIAHTAANSLRRRRGRAATEFAAGYAAAWAVAGAVLFAATRAAGPAPALAFPVAAALAAGWQLTPAKRWFLRRCHRASSLPLRGWRAEMAATVFGARIGASCVGSCWPLMLAMPLAPGPQLPWAVLVAGAVAAERVARRPRRVVGLTAAGAALTALASALAG